MIKNSIKHTQHLKSVRNRQQSNGLSILEILIAVAIISFVFIPAVQILYSIQPQNILNIMSRGADSQGYTAEIINRDTFHQRGDLRVVYNRGGIWNPASLASTNFSRQSCIDFDPTNKTTNSIVPHLFTYTRDELGISTSTILTGTALVGQRLYISANSSSTTEPDVLIYDVPAYSNPLLYGQNVNIPGMLKPTLTFVQSKDFGPGVSSIQSRGRYIISANTGVKNQADISDSELVVQHPFTIPGSNSNTSPLTKVIVYASSTLIVGTEKSVLPEIVSFNIDTGQVLNTIETGYGINDMVVLNTKLIVAGPRDPEIEVFDLDIEHFGQKIGQYDLPGGSGNAKVMAVFGNTLYVGRTKGGNEFVLLDMGTTDSGVSITASTSTSTSNVSTSPAVIHFKEVLNKKINWSIDSVLNFEQYILLFTADEYKEFQLYELVESGLADSLLGDVQALNLRTAFDLPTRVTSSLCFRNTIWVTFQAGSDVPLGLITF